MENQNKNFFTTTAGIIIVVLLVLCCCCFIILAGGLGGAYYFASQVTASAPGVTPFEFNFDNSTPTPTPVVTRVPVENIPTNTLSTLLDTLVPENDPYDLACRLQNICDVPKTLQPPSSPLQIGLVQKFWLTNSDTAENFQVDATLTYITPHSYFWVEKGTSVDKDAMKKLMDTFENKIYPTDREFFGSESNPGIDGDPHIYVIYAAGIGDNIAGYFNSSDEFNPLVRKYSNAHETYVLHSSQDLADAYTYATLAHEFVHMIQFPSDRNDVSWINEGFAEVGAFLNGYDIGGADYEYAMNPDLQLNAWDDSSSPDFGRHYGMSFLYLTYFLDRFGRDATQALTRNPDNDLTSVDSTLKSLNMTDKTTGKIITADDVFADWAVTNYLLDGSVGDGRYTYHNYSNAPSVAAAEKISSCPYQAKNFSVYQYGVDYIDITCSGKFNLRFEGSTQTGLLPADAYSGKYSFWSNKGDESDMTLTREFDFSSVSAPLSMTYRTWYDLEKDYDYLYVDVSTDNGQQWTILKTPSGTDTNPSGNSYGWGYTGKSGGGDTASWIEQSLDLSAYAGQKVQIRFEYITDAAVNGEGLLIDDISVPSLNYSSDFEQDDGGWQAKGFARVENILPQTYRVELIVANGSGTTVTNVELNADQTADIPLVLESGDQATLVVSGTTRFTREDAHYSIAVK